jgi:two-component system, LytTR family, response regulator
MLKAIIVDDEPLCVETLTMQLDKYCPQVEIMAKFTDANKALAYLRQYLPDLLFLDIEMPHLNGFELLNQLKPLGFPVIFTTAYDQFAVRAFKYTAVDYLLKPIDEAELMLAVQRVQDMAAPAWRAKQMTQLLDSYQVGLARLQRIALPTTDGLEFVDLTEIVRCEANSNYTIIVLAGQPPLFISRSLREMEDILANETRFLRVHHSHLINVDRLKKYVRTDGGLVVMDDGTEVPIARSRKDVVLQALTRRG